MILINKIKSENEMIDFNLSYLIIRGIIKEYKNENYTRRNKQSRHASKLLQSKMIQNRINKYVSSATNTYWIDNIIKQVSKTEKAYQQKYHQFRNKKTSWNYCKKSRSSNLDENKQNLKLYEIRLFNRWEVERHY